MVYRPCFSYQTICLRSIKYAETRFCSYSPKQSSRVSRIEEEYRSDESTSCESETEEKKESKSSTKMIDSEMNQITKRIKERELRYLVSSSNSFGGQQEEQTSNPGGILTTIKQRAADERGSKRYLYFSCMTCITTCI